MAQWIGAQGWVKGQKNVKTPPLMSTPENPKSTAKTFFLNLNWKTC